MHDILLSVIVPIYNGRKYLYRCVNSIINQTYKNLEIILVNDGSTDNTLKICLEFEKKDKRVKVINQNNLGVSNARNNALDCSKGNYITFVDSDDYIENDTYFECIKLIEENNLDILRFGYNFVNDNYKTKYKFNTITNKVIKCNDYKNEVFPNILSTDDFSCIWNAIFRKDILTNIKFDKNIKYGEDLLYSYMTILNSRNMYILDIPFYNYMYNDISVTNVVNVKKCISRLKDEILVDSKLCELFLNYIDLNDRSRIRIKNCFIFNLKQIAYKLSYSEYRKYIDEVMKLNCDFLEVYRVKLKKNIFSYLYYKFIKIVRYKVINKKIKLLINK